MPRAERERREQDERDAAVGRIGQHAVPVPIPGAEPDDDAIANSGINPAASGRAPSGIGAGGTQAYGEATPANTLDPEAKAVVRPDAPDDKPFAYEGARGAAPSEHTAKDEPAPDDRHAGKPGPQQPQPAPPRPAATPATPTKPVGKPADEPKPGKPGHK